MASENSSEGILYSSRRLVKNLGALFLGTAMVSIQPAFANNLPAPFPVVALAPAVFVLVTMALSAVGGAYAIKRKRAELGISRRLPLVLRVSYWLVAIPIALYLMALMCLYVPVGLWSIGRAMQMIIWGVQRIKMRNAAPEFLQAASAPRLLSAGVVLFALSMLMLQFWQTQIFSLYKVALPGALRQLEELNHQQSPAPPSK